MLIVRLIIVTCILSLAACAPTPKISATALNSQKAMVPTLTTTVLGPGDVIDVKFRLWPELDYQQSIRPDGKISLQLVDEVTAAGLTPAGLDTHLTELYSTKLKSPEITVVVVSLADQNIYVGGEVENPGVLTLTGNMSALQAVINSGGFKETAEPESAIIIRKGADNKPVPIFVNLHKVLYGSDPNVDVLLKPADIVYVPKSAIAKVNKFVKQYVQDLLLYRGVGIGMSYDLNPDDNN